MAEHAADDTQPAQPAKTAPSGKGGTRLDSDTSKPSTTAPGDGPADTTDPAEQASSVQPDKAAAAADGHLTVNAVVPVTPPSQAATDPASHRFETYPVRRPDGSTVNVRHNIDTGQTSIAEDVEPEAEAAE